MIDLDEAERFIDALTGAPDTPVVIQVFDDDKIRADKRLAFVRIGPVRKFAAALSKANDNGCGIFLQIGAGNRRGGAHITAPRALFADDDNVPLAFRLAEGHSPCSHCGEHHSSDLPPLIMLPPTMIVQSSADERNRHFYWRLKASEKLALWGDAQRQIACHLKTDSLTNVDRVMRLPGSMNRKVDPKKGRDGTPFPVRIVEIDKAREYTIGEVLAEFPDPAVQLPAIVIDFDAGTMTNADGTPIPSPTDLPAQPGDDAPPTPKALQMAERVRQWLTRMQVDYDKKKNATKPLQFVLKRCVFNPDHLNVMAIRVHPTTGALWAGCFHDSCGSNTQKWPEISAKIGGWGLADPNAFLRGDQTEIAERLLRDLAEGSTEAVVYAEGAFRRYSPLSGVWGAIDAATASRVIQGYAGRKIGENGKRLVVDHRQVTGAIALAAHRASRADFFETRAAGIAFANGFVRADGGGVNVVPFAPTHRAQVALPYPYDPEAEYPRFEQFLREIFAPDEDGDKKGWLLQELTGAALLGFATRYETAAFLTGSGANGKSSVIKIIRALFPEGSVVAIAPHDFENEYYRARLAGDSDRGTPPARLNIVAETPEDEMVSAHHFKQIVSGDLTSGRHPAGRPFDFVPIAAHWFVCQELPPTRDQSHGFWRKVKVIDFNRTFDEAEQDKYLVEYILENELPGIAAWAVEGARRLCARGKFIEVASVEATKKAWREDGDAVLRFIRECCTFPPEGQLPVLDTETPIDTLYQNYRMWCAYVGIQPRFILTKHNLGRHFNRIGHKVRVSNSVRYYPLVVHNPPPASSLFN